MIINIQDDILILHNNGLLKRLLEDKTTKKNIMWATDAYNDFGVQYYRNEEIKPELITGRNSDIIKTRARKELEKQFERTRQRAEVFTPLWICKKMNDDAERFWFEGKFGAKEDGAETEYIQDVLKDQKLFKKYIDSKRMEITCGEAPYLVSRYDVATGEMIPVEKRIGLLDRKMQAIGKYTDNEGDWFKWVIRAYQATFGYEFQGDNVLIARVNLLMSLDEYMEARWGRKPTNKEREKIANIVTWNIWQMDGMTHTIPFSKAEEHLIQLDIFDLLADEDETDQHNDNGTIKKQPYCRIYDWHNKKKSLEFQELKKGMHMKFDFIIGNPPYQEETIGDNNQAKPIYNYFMDNAYEISDVVELIHPARFLMRAGATPKSWNEKMLNNKHFRILTYYENSSSVFSGVDIKGGVVISLYKNSEEFEPIGIFIKKDELRGVFQKVQKDLNANIGDIVHSPDSFRFTEELFIDNPELESRTDKAHAKAVASSVFDRYPEIFSETRIENGVKVIGRKNGERKSLYTKQSYLRDQGNLHKWKVLMAGAIGTGQFGEALSDPIIAEPESAHTQTFVSFGEFDTKEESENLAKYLKTKFSRALLGIMKTTQNNQSKVVWSKIPMQDFSLDSDINWSQSVSDVDRQLYVKYGLDQNEIDFIESHVKEMK